MLDVCFACAVQRVIVTNILLTIFYFKYRESSNLAPSTHSVCAQKLNTKLLKLIAGISLSEMGYSLKQVSALIFVYSVTFCMRICRLLLLLHSNCIRRRFCNPQSKAKSEMVLSQIYPFMCLCVCVRVCELVSSAAII